MRKILILLTLLIAASLFLISCAPPAANNSTNKPANAANNAANAVPANVAANVAAIETEIKKLVTDYAAALVKKDVAVFEKTTTDNFMFVSNDGSVQTKAERIASMNSGETKYETLTYDDLNVRVNPEGNGAVVIGKVVVKGTNMGKPVDGANTVTQVWSKTKDGWRMASLHATRITTSPAKPADKTANTATNSNANSSANAAK